MGLSSTEWSNPTMVRTSLAWIVFFSVTTISIYGRSQTTLVDKESIARRLTNGYRNDSVFQLMVSDSGSSRMAVENVIASIEEVGLRVPPRWRSFAQLDTSKRTGVVAVPFSAEDVLLVQNDSDDFAVHFGENTVRVPREVYNKSFRRVGNASAMSIEGSLVFFESDPVEGVVHIKRFRRDGSLDWKEAIPFVMSLATSGGGSAEIEIIVSHTRTKLGIFGMFGVESTYAEFDWQTGKASKWWSDFYPLRESK